MDQERIDELEQLRQKTDLPKKQKEQADLEIQRAEEEFSRAIEAEKNKEGGE